MKQSMRWAAGMLGIFMLFGCSSRVMVIDSTPDTEKIQIVGQIETPAPAAELEGDAASGITDEVSVTPESVRATEAPTPVPTPTPEPTEEPTPEPTEEPKLQPIGTLKPSSAESQKTNSSKKEQFCALAKSFLDSPYQRSGTDPETGFDPGGFVYYCLNEVGVKVRHKTSKGYSEFDSWERVDTTEELLPGDLCFFMTPGNETVNCVCIYLGNDQMIYPSSGEGKVITAKITSKYWTEAFVFARRVF